MWLFRLRNRWSEAMGAVHQAGMLRLVCQWSATKVRWMRPPPLHSWRRPLSAAQ
jgi:hypothetical protein